MMPSFDKAVLIASVVDALNREGSWCSRTHIQKTGFFLQSLGLWPKDKTYEFVLYFHGPYSRELDTDVADCRLIGLLEQEDRPGYGPKQSVNPEGKTLLARRGYVLEDWSPDARIVKWLAPKDVRDLELVATIRMFQEKEQDDDQVVASMRVAKPHFTEHEVRSGIDEVRRVIADAS